MDDIFIKDTQELVERPGALETPFHEQDTFYTPNDRFFVCNVTTTPRVDPASWSLTIAGDAVATPLTLSLDDLTGFEQVELDVLHRSLDAARADAAELRKRAGNLGAEVQRRGRGGGGAPGSSF